MWPPPPDEPRIEFLQSIRVPRDLGMGGNRLVRFLARLVRGPIERGMTRPFAVTVTSEGSIVVADPDGRCVHLFDTKRSRYRRVFKVGEGVLLSPVGVAADTRGGFYVSDSMRGTVHRFDARGRWQDSLGEEGEFLRPTGLAFDGRLNVLWVVDTLGHRVLGYDIDGGPTVTIGRRGRADGEFNYPVAAAVAPSGEIYVTDSMNFRVQVFDPTGSFLRRFGGPGRGPGRLDKTKGIALDADGHVYVVETLHDVIQVFDADGRLLTVVGNTGSGPGEFWLPAGIHVDRDDRILIADSANRRIQVLRYLGDPAGVGPTP